MTRMLVIASASTTPPSRVSPPVSGTKSGSPLSEPNTSDTASRAADASETSETTGTLSAAVASSATVVRSAIPGLRRYAYATSPIATKRASTARTPTIMTPSRKVAVEGQSQDAGSLDVDPGRQHQRDEDAEHCEGGGQPLAALPRS